MIVGVVHGADAHVVLSVLRDDLCGRVGRAIVDDQQFEVVEGLAHDAVERFGEMLGRVVHRHQNCDDGQCRCLVVPHITIQIESPQRHEEHEGSDYLLDFCVLCAFVVQSSYCVC